MDGPALEQVIPPVETQVADLDQFRLEPRCTVCRNELVRRKVNEMLAAGAGYAYIVRALAADNDKLDPRDRVTVDSTTTPPGIFRFSRLPGQPTATSWNAVLRRAGSTSFKG